MHNEYIISYMKNELRSRGIDYSADGKIITVRSKKGKIKEMTIPYNLIIDLTRNMSNASFLINGEVEDDVLNDVFERMFIFNF